MKCKYKSTIERMGDMNDFVNYLNSLNNASGNNENAIAENQMQEGYYFFKRVTVSRAITKHIQETILKNESIVYFLTGHAGDGKTSILLQIIDGIIEDIADFTFKEYDDIRIKNGSMFHYVKDISELSSEEQMERFEHAISLAAEEQTSSVVISNTGQLLELFKRNGFSESESLELIDSAEGKEFNIGNARVKVINIALCDNTDFIRQFIGKVICEDLWEACKNCNCNEKCTTYLNAMLVKKYKDKVSTFVENYYRWLSENNNRATIRQMVSHISYAITGNENCSEDIHKKQMISEADYDNNFANLFFGYKRKARSGLKLDNSALNIKGIRDIQRFGLDQKKMNIEYEIFVKEDFSAFSEKMQPYVKKLWREYKLSDSQNNLTYINTIKRVYMMFNELDKGDEDIIYKEIYSNVFPYYIGLKNNQSNPQSFRKVESIVFKGLFKLFTGFAPNNEDRLFLTIKQNGEKIQNVQYVQGYIIREDLRVSEKTKYNKATDEPYKVLYMELGDAAPIYLSYRMLEFLEQVSRGIVQTQIDPMLSQGIDNIKTVMRKVMRKSREGELLLLVYTEKGTKVKRISIEENNIAVGN